MEIHGLIIFQGEQQAIIQTSAVLPSRAIQADQYVHCTSGGLT